MLITASDASFEHPRMVSGVLVAAIVGPTRAAIEAGDSRTFDGLKLHLTALCVGYLKQVWRAAAGQSQDSTAN